jgi:hypothetical protein
MEYVSWLDRKSVITTRRSRDIFLFYSSANEIRAVTYFNHITTLKRRVLIYWLGLFIYNWSFMFRARQRYKTKSRHSSSVAKHCFIPPVLTPQCGRHAIMVVWEWKRIANTSFWSPLPHIPVGIEIIRPFGHLHPSIISVWPNLSSIISRLHTFFFTVHCFRKCYIS